MIQIKKSWRRFIPMLAAVIAALPVLSGCKGDSQISQDGGGTDSSAYVMNIGGYDISKEEYNYYFLNEKYMLDQGDDTFWDTATDEQKNLKERADANLKEFYAMKKLADDAGIPSDGQLAEDVDKEIAGLVEKFGGQETFNEVLTENNLTEDMYRMLSLESFRSIELFRQMFGDEVKKSMAENYLRAAHILIAFNENAVDTESAKAQAKERAEEVLAKVEAGEDFFKLVEEYGEDPGMVDNLDGYYFKEGDMVEPFYEGAIALKEGETSGLVETSYGYHIIKRLPMEDSYINEHIMELANVEHFESFMSKINETIDSLEVKKEASYDSISLENALKENAA